MNKLHPKEHQLKDIIDVGQRTKFIKKNQELILDMEIKIYKERLKSCESEYYDPNNVHKNSEEYFCKKKKMKDKILQFQKKKKNDNEITLNQRKLDKIIGLREGLISLPKLPNLNEFKKLSEKEEQFNQRQEAENRKKALWLEHEDQKMEYKTHQLDWNDKLSQKEKYYNRIFEENEIKKLNDWDTRYLDDIKKKKQNTEVPGELKSKKKPFMNSLESSSIKWMFDTKNNKKQLELLKRNPKLEEFFNRLETEQNAIYEQNMQINKKNFQFDIFMNVPKSKQNEEEEKQKINKTVYEKNIQDSNKELLLNKNENQNNPQDLTIDNGYNTKPRFNLYNNYTNCSNNNKYKINLKKNQLMFKIDNTNNINNSNNTTNNINNNINSNINNKNNNNNTTTTTNTTINDKSTVNKTVPFRQSNMNVYKSVIKEKIKIEEFLKNELAVICEKIFYKKIEKKNILEKLEGILSQIAKLNEKKKIANELYVDNLLKAKKIKILKKKENPQAPNLENLGKGSYVLKRRVKRSNTNTFLKEIKKEQNTSNPFERSDSQVNKNYNKKLSRRLSLVAPKKKKNKIKSKNCTVKFTPLTEEYKRRSTKRKSTYSLDNSKQINIKNLLAEKLDIKEKEKQIGNLEFQLKTKILTYQSKIKSLEKDFKDAYYKSVDIANDLRSLRVNANNRIKEHRQYYIDILKKGIDVRKDGLSWIVVRLLELKTFVENSMFPKFLSITQIEYLNKIAIKQYELTELIKLFQVMKKRQQKLREKFGESHDIDDYAGLKNLDANPTFAYLKSDHKDGVEKEKENIYQKKLEEIAKRYETYINVCLNEKKEQQFLNAIVQDLHNQIQTGTRELFEEEKFNQKYFLPGSLAQFFNENKKFREHFDDIYYLRTEIVNKERDIKNFKKNAIKEFKEKMKAQCIEESEQSELLFSALFGNGIYI